MSATGILTALLVLWVVITVAMIVMWLLRRRTEDLATLGMTDDQAWSHDETPFAAEPADDIDSDSPEPQSAPDQSILGVGNQSDGRPEGGESVVLGRAGASTDDGEIHRPTPTAPEPESNTGSADGAEPDEGPLDGDRRDGAGSDSLGDRDLLPSSTLGVGLATSSDPHPDAKDDATPPPAMSTAAVAGMLAEAELPYELEPLSTGGHADRITYRSSHPDPEDVGIGFADELVRLGFSIEPVAIDRALAQRDDDVLHLRIIPAAGTVLADDGSTLLYGQIGAADTVVEVWSGPTESGSVRW